MDEEPAPLVHPAWSLSANIYEVNLRQYTREGTFAAFEAHLPRLRHMGVDILWFMPIHPIGALHRKGTLGSPYSVADHLAVNPEFGTLADFKRLVEAAHALGMHVLIDWVANHTAWDHPWMREHPDWYRKNTQGEIAACEFHNGSEVEHWSDVVALDYTVPAVWQAMTDALVHWVREAGIDGYRCDVAGLLPLAFWERAREALDAIKPVFMLAEWSGPELHRRAFDMSYDWDLYDAMRDIASGRSDARAIVNCIEKSRAAYPRDAIRMLFTTNHDKNTWHTSDTALFGDAFKAFAVLAATLPGMPLVYGGQEAVLDRRLAFFEKDPIDWKTCALSDFYRDFLQLKKQHRALWNGEAGGDIVFLPCCDNELVAFRRRCDGDSVTVAVNLAARERMVEVRGAPERLGAWGWIVVAT